MKFTQMHSVRVRKQYKSLSCRNNDSSTTEARNGLKCPDGVEWAAPFHSVIQLLLCYGIIAGELTWNSILKL